MTPCGTSRQQACGRSRSVRDRRRILAILEYAQSAIKRRARPSLSRRGAAGVRRPWRCRPHRSPACARWWWCPAGTLQCGIGATADGAPGAATVSPPSCEPLCCTCARAPPRLCAATAGSCDAVGTLCAALTRHWSASKWRTRNRAVVGTGTKIADAADHADQHQRWHEPLAGSAIAYRCWTRR